MSVYVNSGISAAGTTTADATALLSVANVNQISTCAAGAGVRLPDSMARGTIVRIRNDGAGYGFVYPPTGGTINGMAVNAGYIVGRGGEAEFVFADTLTVFGFNTNAVQAIIPVAAATSLTAAHSGHIIQVSQAAAYNITLPAVATSAGLRYTFILDTVGANVVQINGAAGTPVIGWSIVGPQAGATIRPGAGTLGVRFSTTCLTGDRVDLVCNGTNWFTQGWSGSNTAATAIIFA